MNLRSTLYAAARLLGDINAIAKARIVQRLVRKTAIRATAQLVNRVLR